MDPGLKQSVRVEQEHELGFVKSEDLGEKKEVSEPILGWVRQRGYLGSTFHDEKEKINTTSEDQGLIAVKEAMAVQQPATPFKLSNGEKFQMKTEYCDEVMENVSQEISNNIIKSICEEINLAEEGEFPCEPKTPGKSPQDEYRRVNLENIYKIKEREEEIKPGVEVIEDGDFPVGPEWVLVGRTMIMGVSNVEGKNMSKNEIVRFTFRFSCSRMEEEDGKATLSIVCFRTKRSGEIGYLPWEWTKSLVPIANSSTVKVLGRYLHSPVKLRCGQPIMLSASFYIHNSVFIDAEKSSRNLEPTRVFTTTTRPLLSLLNLLKVHPSQNAELAQGFDSRRRWLNFDDETDEISPFWPSAKRRKGCSQAQHQIKNEDEQSISESYLNNLVGALDVYNLKEMEPPETLNCNLRQYQKQALYWMIQLETGKRTEGEGKILHPCWTSYSIRDERVREIYVNIFSEEATTQFPSAMPMPRGGIFADAMGLGKTVTTIALILARRGRGSEDKFVKEERAFREIKGGTLIVCPMALLSQWKKEIETHTKSGSISILVHYGGDRTDNPEVLAEADVVLTTYGVLSSAYAKDLRSVLHYVEWHRVVLDEAHIIKSYKSKTAKAAFGLSSYCRWCLTGTPLQNTLDDLYSLLCFLRVDPWCNWDWWKEQIKRPYGKGDQRSLKLLKAILKPLMLRRTKESKDKQGRPILKLPPIDIQILECELSETERDFYDALFKRSKVQFDKYVAQGKILQNYANILELLLRLRQCCDHPFLVMNRGYSQESTDLDQLSRKFLQTNPTQTGPSRAFVEEVVSGLRNGENPECPICFEPADEPVITPCAHRMCRECLLLGWSGRCPICRQILQKNELITCPSPGRFKFDVKGNWTESTKISMLLEYLELLRFSNEKTIVFSQWTSFLNLLEIPLKERDLGFLRFHGTLSQKERGQVLNEFSETEDKTILLMSLKAGGVGLNLTAASNVFIMDPWWNPAVEEQAIMRVHRIGQDRPVRVRRFIVKNSVEERMLEVQKKKLEMIAGALTDEEFRQNHGIEELKMLFR